MYKKDYSSRRFVIIFIFITITLIYVVKLYYIQVEDNRYLKTAKGMTLRKITEYPARGKIYDRNNKLIVYNDAVYDLMVIPRQVKNLDTADFCKLLGIDKEYFNKRMSKAIRYSHYKPSIFIKQLSKEDYARIEDKMYKIKVFLFKGVHCVNIQNLLPLTFWEV